MARAESFSVVSSLRFLRRPYQLGQAVDLGLQYRYEQFDDALAGVLGRKRDHSVQLTLSFGFQMMFDDYFGERDDILNMEHGYIP